MHLQDIHKIPFGVAAAYLDRPEIQDIRDTNTQKAQAVMLAVSDLYNVELPRKQSRRGRMRAPTTLEHFTGLREKGHFDVYPIVAINESMAVEESWTVEASSEADAIRAFKAKTLKQPVLNFEVSEVNPPEYLLVTRGADSVNKVVYAVSRGQSRWEEEESVSAFDTQDAAIAFAEALALTSDMMVHIQEHIVSMNGYANDIRIYREVSKKGVFEFNYQTPGNLKKHSVDFYMAVLPFQG